jgi:Sugar phosphate isomerases/epimerases
MPSRRQFVKQSSLATASFFIPGHPWFAPQKKIGLQLYTLRNEMQQDAKGTLKKVAEQGYNLVETFGYENGQWWGMPVAALKSTLQSLGLSTPSGHTYNGSFFLKNGWEDTWKKTVADVKTLGQEFVVIPWLEEDNRSDADNFKKIAEGLNKAGEICKQYSLKLAYHNHDFEFDPLTGGRTGLDILLHETDARLVLFELDLYWTVKAGRDPVALFERHPKRFALWHVKDMDNTPKKFFTEVGNGVIDFKKIFAQAKQSGMKYFFVEQDECPGPPLESTAKSIAYLKKNIVN